MKKKENYETPSVEVLEARVEKGFSGSGNGISSNNPDSGAGTQSLVEGYNYLWN